MHDTVSVHYPKHARKLTVNAMGQPANCWTLLENSRFQDIDEMAALIRGWDIDFRPLQAGRSGSGLLQFGSPDLTVTRFDMAQAHEQRGSTPPNRLTLGFLNAGTGNAQTPEGTVSDDVIWCFPPGQEFVCASRARFRAFGLSLSDTLLDDAADLCELPAARVAIGAGGILRCGQRSAIDAIRHRFGRISRDISSGAAVLLPGQSVREMELDLARQILEALAGPQDLSRSPMTHRKRLVLYRALEYLKVNPHSPVTVIELAQAAGAGLRTLEYVFKAYFGVTPKAYLTSLRLIGARRQLQHSGPSPPRVSDAAIAWGFSHLGRFSRDYYRFFGELPSRTHLKKNSPDRSIFFAKPLHRTLDP